MKYYKVNHVLFSFLFVMVTTCTCGAQSTINSTNKSVHDTKRSAFPDSLLGKIYRDATELGATRDLGGNMIGDAGYSFHLSIFNEQKVVFLSKVIKTDDPSKVKHIVKSVLLVPLIDKTIIQMSNCAIDAKDDETVIALVIDESAQLYTNVKKAWKVNLKTETFIEIPTSTITCDNVSYDGI